MKKRLLFIALLLFTIVAGAQMQPAKSTKTPDEFAKQKIANICRYIDVTKEDSTKLHKVYLDYQKEGQAAINDKEKLGKIVKGLQGKIEEVLGKEKYKIYREKYLNDIAIKDKASH